MSKKSKSSFMKRQKEMARQQRQRDKQARRFEAKDRPASREAGAGGEDPDIAGIRPGPQPLPDEWNYVPPAPRVARPDDSGS